MVKHKYALLFFFILISTICSAQLNYFRFNKNDFASVKSWVQNFLRKENKVLDSSIFIVGLSNKFTYPLDLNTVGFVPGIYKFGMNITHSALYLLIVGKRYSMVFKNYKPVYVSEMINRQIKILQIKDTQKQLTIMQNVLMVLSQRSGEQYN